MNKNRRNPKTSYMIRIIAGAYLVILGFQIAAAPFKEETGLPLGVAVGLGVLLGLAGVIILIFSFKGYSYVHKHPEEFEEAEESEEDENAEAETEAEEPAEEIPALQTGASSIRQRASIPEHLRVSEDDEEQE